MLPISSQELDQALSALEIVKITTATIRQICSLAAELEKRSGETFVHLEIGNPGLPAEQVGIEAQCRALHSGVANKYPNIAGIPELKKAGREFIKAFLNADVAERGIIPTVGSMQGSFTLQLILAQRLKGRDTMLFLDPGFPAQHNQAKLLGMETVSVDIYNYRGAKALEAKLEEVMASGRITAMIYSNPNNPAWTNLTEEELEVIGRLATKHDVIVLEDLAYLGMDFRRDCSVPYQAPYVPTVARYTDNYILLLSASKIFSYAGERIAMVCISPAVYDRKYEFFEQFYEMPSFGDSYVFGVLYCSSSGTSHSVQYAFAEMLAAATRGELDFVDHSREYARRAAIIKDSLERNGFHIVYAKDGEENIGDGFFFTAGYGDLTSEQLQRELLRYGISSISLPSTGSRQDGVRICVSAISAPETFEALDQRLKLFADEHPKD